MDNYILMAKRGGAAKVHDSLPSANQEAHRLCAKEECPIVIYKAIGEVRPKELPIEFISYEENENGN